MHDPEMRNPAEAATKARAISQTNSNTADIATNEKANQPETASCCTPCGCAPEGAGAMSEQFQTGLKKAGRGMARASLDLIATMYVIAEAAQPITGRGIGYKLFTAGLITSMSVNEMQKVYRLLRIARCETVNAAELESMQTILSNWKGGRP